MPNTKPKQSSKIHPNLELTSQTELTSPWCKSVGPNQCTVISEPKILKFVERSSDG